MPLEHWAGDTGMNRKLGTGTVCFAPGEWVATAGGQVIAHGFDFYQVAQEACGRADDIAFERIPFQPARPDPAVSLPASPGARQIAQSADGAPHRAAPPRPLLR